MKRVRKSLILPYKFKLILRHKIIHVHDTIDVYFNKLNMEKIKNKHYKSKQEVRELIWKYMEENNLISFPRPCYGRIPNFLGSHIAGKKLKTLSEWKDVKTIFSAPDSSLHAARAEALKEGKSLLVAAPKLIGFYFLESISPENAYKASTIKGFSKFGKKVKISPNLPKINLYITGAVAVDKKGNRIGKGTGYGDKEDAILSDVGLIDNKTPRVVIVHDVQIFEDFYLLMENTDKKVTIIVTPNEIYRIN